jgi:hypothetical protein
LNTLLLLLTWSDDGPNFWQAISMTEYVIVLQTRCLELLAFACPYIKQASCYVQKELSPDRLVVGCVNRQKGVLFAL